MSGLPTQIPWRRFVCVLRKLGYTAQKGKAGSARSFLNPSRSPEVVSFQEPIPEATSARRCCACIFANFFSTRMSSCSF
jgi:hypothetical protein